MQRSGLVDAVQIMKVVRNLEIMAYWKEYKPKVVCLWEQCNVERHRGLQMACYKERVSFSSAHTKESKMQ